MPLSTNLISLIMSKIVGTVENSAFSVVMLRYVMLCYALLCYVMLCVCMLCYIMLGWVVYLFRYFMYLFHSLTHLGGPGGSVGIATDYGLDGPGIESRWGEIFCPSRLALGPTQPPVQWVLALFQGKVRLGRAADHSPPSSAAVMEE